MKHTRLWLLLIGLVAVRVFAHEGHHGGSRSQAAKEQAAPPSLQSVYQNIAQSYTQQVQGIFAAKCADCHSAKAEAPWYASLPLVGHLIEKDRREAKKHLEISNGFPFAGHGTPDEDLAAIQESVLQNTMPTKLYRFVHPSRALTETEKTAILAWVRDSRSQTQKAQTPENPK